MKTLTELLQRPAIVVIVTGILILGIEVAEFLAPQRLGLLVAFVFPIAYAVWGLGRKAGLIVACLAEVGTAIFFARLIAGGRMGMLEAGSTLLLRLTLFVATAEIMYRMKRAMTDARSAESQLAIANSDLRALYARQDEDLATAGDVQREVLAFVIPTLPGLEVGAVVRYAGKTGGDFVDLGAVDGRAYLCVADVSGKGATASLFTILLKHILDQALRRGLRDGRVVEALYRELRPRLTSDKFVTLFYAEIDPTNGVAEYVNAGHTEGLIVRTETQELATTQTTAPLLSPNIAIPDFPVSALEIETGDVVVIYSDGATDSKTPSGKPLGDDLIRRLAVEYSNLAAQEMADSICDRIEAETDPRMRDDLVVVCVRRLQQCATPADGAATIPPVEGDLPQAQRRQ